MLTRGWTHISQQYSNCSSWGMSRHVIMLYLMLCCREVGINQAVMCWVNTYRCNVDSKSQMHLMCQVQQVGGRWYVCVCVCVCVCACERQKNTWTHTHTQMKRGFMLIMRQIWHYPHRDVVFISLPLPPTIPPDHNSLCPDKPWGRETETERSGRKKWRGEERESNPQTT